MLCRQRRYQEEVLMLWVRGKHESFTKIYRLSFFFYKIKVIKAKGIKILKDQNSENYKHCHKITVFLRKWYNLNKIIVKKY